MNIEDYRNFCLSKPGVTEEVPFGPETLVFKVMGKMFALTDIESFSSINLKCDPDIAEKLREEYPAVMPGYHMNKKHWNTIMMDGSVADAQIREWINQSYDLVISGLTKKQKEELAGLA
ncbi:MmcQ/YjbR family DNA-binding protein [Marinoscillum sp. MHG1-6]|uniref:MmcQ/YjbR family DNA-binding protein n=1 Tax=Marinoscillum sp. MHG1-6 TaxID=2959627 RepID=UPI0021574B4D|nr:MmcQ/YjbR family DNA-binding protein [Marinoscillum sp. MHG1-6]